MHNSSTSNSDMRRFLRKMALRGAVTLVLVLAVFAIRWSKAYYYTIPEGTSFSKIPWIYRQLEANRIDDQTVLFVGSSICKGGVNDSLFTFWDSSGTKYLNLGVSHSCNAITAELLRELVERRGIRPKKVYLCLKSDARPSNIHAMYPVIADGSSILQSFGQSNIRATESVFKKAAWNINWFTEGYKFDASNPDLVHHSEYGYEAYKETDSVSVMRLYQNNLGPVKSTIEFMRTTKGRHGEGGIKRKLSNLKMDYLDNMVFQDHEFEACASILDQAGIPYEVILYPNMIVAREEAQGILSAYYSQLYSGIDFQKHPILTVEDVELKGVKYWQDMNHLNKRGAEVLSHEIFSKIN
jgi:hypothetical protein